MKTLTKVIGGLLAALSLSFLVLADGGGVITHSTQSFLNGCNMVVSNNTTIYWYSTNEPFTLPTGNNFFAYSNYNVLYTNAVGTTTNVLGGYPCIVDCNGFSDANGGVAANASIIIAMNWTNLFNGGAAVIPNPNNSNNATNWSPVITPTAASTNTMTFTFQRSVDGYANQYPAYGATTSLIPNTFGTTAQDEFIVVLAAPGATPSVVCTNLPSGFMTGTRRIRLLSVVASTASTSPGVIVNVCKLGGYGGQ